MRTAFPGLPPRLLLILRRLLLASVAASSLQTLFLPPRTARSSACLRSSSAEVLSSALPRGFPSSGLGLAFLLDEFQPVPCWAVPLRAEGCPWALSAAPFSFLHKLQRGAPLPSDRSLVKPLNRTSPQQTLLVTGLMVECKL